MKSKIVNSTDQSVLAIPDLSKICKSELPIQQKYYFKLEEDIKKVKYPTNPISKAEKLEVKISSFPNQNVQNKLYNQLKKLNLNSYRQVRGDGNCFFRALAFSFISNLRQPSFTSCFSLIRDIKLTCCYPQSIPKDFHKFYDNNFLLYVLQRYWQVTYGNCLKQSEQMDKKALLKLFDENPFLDFIVVLYFRAVCLKSLYINQEEFKNFITGGEQTSIRTYSEETEGISLHLCSKIFNINIYVYEVRKEEINTYRYEVAKTKRDTPCIYLLFNESHYDIIELNSNIDAEEFGLQRKETYYGEVENKFIQGNCIECGKPGKINQASCLCVSCNEASLCNLNNFTKAGLMAGQCGQCGKMREDISIQLGLCKRCVEASQDEEKRTQVRSMKKNVRCKLCNQITALEQIQFQTGICSYCIRAQQSAINKIEISHKKKTGKQQDKQQNNDYPRPPPIPERSKIQKVEQNQSIQSSINKKSEQQEGSNVKGK